MKKVLYLLLILLPITVSAQTLNQNLVESDSDIANYKVVSETEKYYKTITIKTSGQNNVFSNRDNLLNTLNTFSVEITKEEYDNYDESVAKSQNFDTIESEYKKMTISILKNGNQYAYKAVLEWKLFPKIRSYDILAIGFYQSVKASAISYLTEACTKDGNCSNLTTHLAKKTTTGVGVTFLLPSSTDLKSLKSTLIVYVAKNTSSVITSQKAVADYSHAIKEISSSLATDYSINTSGIKLSSSNSSYYDTLPEATSILETNW